MTTHDSGNVFPTLIVPTTSSRIGHFTRVLDHLADARISGRILVSDHSATGDESIQLAVGAACARTDHKLDLDYLRHDPSLHFLERVALCLEVSPSPYAMLHADDDFVVPSALQRCAAYLDSHPDTVVCQGRMAHFRVTMERDKAERERVRVEPRRYPCRARTEDRPMARLLRLLSSYSASLYGVHRRETLIEAIRHTLRHCQDVTFWQYLLTGTTVLQGKAAVIEEFHYLRLAHDDSWSRRSVDGRDADHVPWVFLSPEFSRRTTAFREGLLSFMRENHGNPPDAFFPVFDDACLWLFRRALGGGTEEADDPNEDVMFRRLAQPGTAEYDFVTSCAQRFAQKGPTS